jgi:hypothetical protein
LTRLSITCRLKNKLAENASARLYDRNGDI